MKKLLYLFLVFVSLHSLSYAGGGGGGPVVPCSSAQPFCTDDTYDFPNETNTSAPTGPNYGCLGSEPNPVWFYMQIDVAGPMTFSISQSSSPGGAPNLDVDYALWGPFSSVTNGCNSITAGSSAPIGCSYSTAATETVSIANAQLNMFYIIMITNFDEGAGYITFNQTGGSGVADCGLLTPCDMTNLTATPGACNPANNQYSLTGQITFSSPPASGTLTVTSSCGGSQTFNAPFGSPANYSLTGLTSNGANCTVTATFSADNTCTRTQNYIAPAPCLPCNMTGITTNVGACNPANNQYTVSGNITYVNPPTTGTLTITGSCGGTQTYNAPFTSPDSYNFTGLTSNGAPCTITAVFSANPACTINQNYTAPVNCTPPCLITNLTANIGTCQTNNSFPVTGTFSYSNSPATGTVTVTVTNGTGSQSQVFNAPFTNGTNFNYNIPNNYSDGSALTVTVVFSASPACTMSLSSTSPPNCLCPAQIGTFTTTTTNGNTTSPIVLCFGHEVEITANNNYTPPGIALAPPNPGGYEPGITWLVYSCPPTVALVPSLTEDIPDDPCLLGLYSDFDMYDINDQYWMTNFPGVFTNNTVYFVPITMYNLTEGLYSYVNTSMPCYDLGTPIAIQYLPDVTFTQVQSCTAVTATVTGGLPAVNGSQFTASGLTPANATFGNTTANNGGTITVNGLTPGQAYSFTVTDGNGCPRVISGTFTGGPTLSYPLASYCPVGTINATITGPTGGSYSATPAGLSINASTGAINLAASTPNSYTITYTSPAVPGPACPATFALTVNPLPVVVANNVTVCVGGTVAVTASGASTYSWSPATFLSATTGSSVNFVNGSTTNYTVTGTSAAGCIGTDPVTVTVNGNAPINAGPDVAICLGASTTLTASGGTTYSWNNGLGAGASHSVSPATTTTYTVNGTDVNGCLGSDQVQVTVNPNPAPTITGPSTYCAGTPAVLTTQAFTSYLWTTGSVAQTTNAVDTDGNITVTVIDANGCTGTSPAVSVSPNAVITFNDTKFICQGGSFLIHGVSQTTAGVYSQTFVLPTGCDSTANITLVVNPLPAVNAGADQAVCLGTPVTLTAVGAPTLVWTGGVANGAAFVPATTTTYTVTGTDLNGCINTDQVVVTVNPNPVVSAGPDVQVCAGTQVTLTGTGADNYSWTAPVAQGVAFTPPVGTNVYTVVGTTLAGCTGTDQVTVTVNPNPVVFAGNDVAVCQGQSVTLTGSGALNYTWDNGAVNGVTFVPALGTLTYTVTGTTASGCTGTDQMNVLVNPNPIIDFSPDIVSGCVPLTVTFTNNTPGQTNCIWTLSDGSVLNGCGSVTHTFTQPGCFDVTLTTSDPNGCSGTLTATDLICLEADPIASFIPSETQLSTLDTEVDFNNTTIGASDYIWNFGDNSPTSTVVYPSHIYNDSTPGSYTVTLIAFSPLGCVDTATVLITIYEELIFYVPNSFTPDLDDYNPVFLPIFHSGFDPQDYSLMIYNRWGEVIFESHNAEVGWDGSYGQNREVEMVQDGTYTWKIEFKVTRWDERKVVHGHVNVLR
ncbi:MAG: PKD domain-containing protein [Bacteroidota bacterium]